MTIKETVETLHDLTQPVTLGIGGAVFLGFSVDDLLKIGTALLLCLNIPLAALRISDYFKRGKDE